MFQITVKSGIAKGTSWPIPENGLRIGRDAVCEVSLADSLVSRFHCRLSPHHDGVLVRDLDSSNATLVNGLPVKEHISIPGDEVSVGDSVFIVGICEDSLMAPHVPPPPGTTLTLTEKENVYLSDEIDARERDNFSVGDIVLLFQSTRDFCQALSVEELLDRISRATVKRLQPLSYWLALVGPTSPKLELHRTGGTGLDEPEACPYDLLNQALAEGQGFLVPEQIRLDDRPSVQVTMAAPLHAGSQAVGAMAVQTHLPQGVYDENDLQFLVALTRAVASYIVALRHQEALERENLRLRAGGSEPVLIGESTAMKRLTEMMRRLAGSEQPVLITGETGAGKDVVANLLHQWSSRGEGPFVAVNCAAIPSELFESTVFGHEKGAFTGATEKRKGLLAESDGGTLFLDEVGDLSSEHQARILRAIETKRFRPVGTNEEETADFRILAATNRNPEEQLRQGTLREDLYHRLRGVALHVPPLRERPEDIPLLAEHFLDEACKRDGLREPRKLTGEALALLQTHTWPGNVRELRACVEASLVFATGLYITPDALTQLICPGQDKRPPTLAEMEERLIKDALDYCGGNVVEAAKVLGVGKDRVYRRLAEYRSKG